MALATTAVSHGSAVASTFYRRAPAVIFALGPMSLTANTYVKSGAR